VCAALNPDEVDDHFLSFAWLNLTPKNRARVISSEPKTFWLLGAGASHHYDLNPFGVPVPLANGFFEAFSTGYRLLKVFSPASGHLSPFFNITAALARMRSIISSRTSNSS